MLEVLNPATEEVVESLEPATEDDADAAIARAREAFPAWRDVQPDDRSRLLRRLADALEGEQENLAQLESKNTGKPIGDSRAEMAMVAETFHYYAGMPERLLGDTIPVSGGVDVAFERIVLEAGIPEGVVNVVVGPGSVVGRRLVEHPDVAKVAFTGSTEIGKSIMAGAAGTIKRVTLELGGKSANVIFADADLEKAAASAPIAVFGNAGQDCCARSRVLVEKGAFDEFLSLMEPAVTGMRVGDPFDEATEMGPLISADHREKVAAYVPEDAPVAIRGQAPEGSGFWYPPIVLAPVSNDDKVAREEIFGPVVAIIPFEDEDDAIRQANDTEFGLSGSIWTENGARALRVARRMETGVISINSNTSVRVATPLGGFKQSGVGRELGPHALDYYTEVKNVYLSTEED